MISDLTGSTTEPVIRNRITRVVTTTIASASGQVVLEARLEVDEVRRGAGDEHGRPGRFRKVAEPLHGRLARLGHERALGDRVDLGHARREPLRAARPRRPRDRARPRRRQRPIAFGPPPSIASRIGVSRKGGKSERITSSTWRALALSGSTCASTEVNLMLRKGIPSAISNAALRRRDRDRPPHHEAREPVPEPGLGRGSRRARRGAAGSAARARSRAARGC